MCEHPLVSIVMPVYNTEKYVSKAIESILAQTFADFEFIIIDDWSTDWSWDIVLTYASFDERIKPVQNWENLWICETLNVWINLSVWEYIARMDADDISEPSRISKQLIEMNWSREKIVGTNISLIDQHWSLIWMRKYPIFWEKKIALFSPIAHPTAMFSKHIIQKHWAYNIEWNYVEDYEMRIRFYNAWVTFFNIQEPLLKYRISLHSTKSKKTKETLRKTIVLKYSFWKKWLLSLWTKWIWRLFWEIVLLLLPSIVINNLFIFLTVEKNV